MTTPHRLSRQEARRIAVRAQLLDEPRPNDMVDVVRRLTMLQFDQTNAVAPSADLVLWSRLGSAYAQADLDAALADGRLVEYRGMVRPSEDIALYRADMVTWPGVGTLRPWRKRQGDWVAANDGCRRDLLRRLRDDGAATARELPDTCAAPWPSSGWNNNRNVTMMLEFMEQRGEVGVIGREGRDRVWDLGERVFADTPAVPAAEAERIRNERRLAALGIARATGPECPVEPVDVADIGEPAVVEGVRGEWRVDPVLLAAIRSDAEAFAGRAALLSPFDRLINERNRSREIFEFDYALEMYKPVEKRKWGYYALPILYEDRLVGKLDAKADRAEGGLRVDAVHQDVPFTKAMAAEIDGEIADLALWLAQEFDRAG